MKMKEGEERKMQIILMANTFRMGKVSEVREISPPQ